MHAFRFSFRRFCAATGTLVAATAAVTPSSSTTNNKEAESSLKRYAVPYLLVGGGTASYYAALTIRARDPEARVLIVSDEKESPYNRPPLSKDVWWYGDEMTPNSLSYIGLSGRRRELRFEADGFYPSMEKLNESKHGAVALIRNKKVVKVDIKNRFIELEDGSFIDFDKCLIATGSKPKILPELNGVKSVTTLKNVEDYRQLHSILQDPSVKSVAVVGNDLLATELAYSLNRRFGRISSRLGADGCRSEPIKVYQIIPESNILTRILPKKLSDYSVEQMRILGIDVLTNCSINAIPSKGGKVKMVLKRLGSNTNSKNDQLEFDHVVMAIGQEPNLELAKRSGLELDEETGGVKADANMRASEYIWVAGDICSFEDPTFRSRRRVDHWENAQVTGRVAGENMTEGNKKYSHQAGFYSVYGIGDHLNAVGEVDANRYSTFVYLFKPSDSRINHNGENEDDQLKAVVFYLNDEKHIIGILFLNIYGMALEIARKIITDGKVHQTKEELTDLTKLFDVFNEKEQEEDNQPKTEGDNDENSDRRN